MAAKQIGNRSSISGSHPQKSFAVDSFIQGSRERFEAIEDSRRSASVGHSLADCLMAAFAMFSLKELSWLYTIAIRQASDFLRKENRHPIWPSMVTVDCELSGKEDRSTSENSEVLKDVWSVARSVLLESQ